MKLLIPLGLLGLLALIILFLIYILKPNYQQKAVSSTYIWKLSLKYKKKRVPVSRLRHLLILLCQVFILCGAAFVLSNPVIVHGEGSVQSEKIFVIDASANMLAASDGETRFQRAVDKVQNAANEAFSNDELVTIIQAGEEASFLVQRIPKAQSELVTLRLSELVCSYGKGDIDGAMLLAEEVLNANSDAEVILYTGTEYTNKGLVTVENVAIEGEWNIAILSAKAELVDNFYVFTIEVASYGADKMFNVCVDVSDSNGKGYTVALPTTTVQTYNGEPYKIIYSVETRENGYNTTYVTCEDEAKTYSFDSVRVYIDDADAADNYSYDNEYYIYGGNKQIIKVLYYSTLPNPYVEQALQAVQTPDPKKENSWFDKYELKITEAKNDTPEIKGYDMYIFEHKMPSVLPTDGVIFMINPDNEVNAGFTLGRTVKIPNWSGDGATLSPGIAHPIMGYIDATNIRLTEYTQVNESTLTDYEVLMYYEGNPVFFVKNETDSKIAVLPFSLNNSTLGISFYFSILMTNFFHYYFPAAFENNAYDVYSTVTLNARGSGLTLLSPGDQTTSFDTDSVSFVAYEPGTYTVTQTLISNASQTEKFYVRIASSQSNIVKVEDVLTNPNVVKKDKFTYDDLLVYLAAAITALLFIEWILQSREGF